MRVLELIFGRVKTKNILLVDGGWKVTLVSVFVNFLRSFLSHGNKRDTELDNMFSGGLASTLAPGQTANI